MQTLLLGSLPPEERIFLDEVIGNRQGRPGALLGIVEAAQEKNRHKYPPTETLGYIAGKMDLPLARIYSVTTFYALCNLQPQGRKHDLHLPRHSLPHTRLEEFAASRAARAWAGPRGR